MTTTRRKAFPNPDNCYASMSRMGRRGKGPRELLGTRVTPRHAQAVRKCAEEEGLSVSDYIAAILARETGLHDEAAHIIPTKYQEALPVSA